MLETNCHLWNWNLLWLFPCLHSRMKSSVVSQRFLSALGRFPVDGPWSSWPSLTQLIPLSLSPLTQTGSLACRACRASRNLSVLSGSSLFIPSCGLCHPAEREVKQGCVCGSFCSLHCVRPKCHLMDRKRREVSMWLLLTMKWLKFLVANISASQWWVHICIYHRLRPSDNACQIIFTLQVYDLTLGNIGTLRINVGFTGCEASDGSSRRCSKISKRETTGHFWLGTKAFQY